MDVLKIMRDAKIALKREHARIIHLYKQEIYDWCGHDLACELVAQKGGVPDRIVRRVVANASAIFR